MKATRSGWGWMVGAVSVALVAGCAHPKSEAAHGVAWNASYGAALADAGKTGRPILLDFYTDW